MFAHLDRTNAFIIDCEKLRPFSEAEATGLLATMRALDGQEPHRDDPFRLSEDDDVYALNVPGTALGVTYRREGDRVQLLTCERKA